MTLNEWINYFNYDMVAVNAVYYLQKQKPYTDDEIIDAINKIKKVAIQYGLTRGDIMKTIFANETTKLSK